MVVIDYPHPSRRAWRRSSSFETPRFARLLRMRTVQRPRAHHS